jgi:uncharacterized membrane protein
LKKVASSMMAAGDAAENAKGKTADWANGLTAIASGLMSLSMLLSSFDSLIDTINDPDLSGWDKFLAILSSVSMVAMSLVSIFGALTTALVAFKIIKDKENISTWLNTILTKKNS